MLKRSWRALGLWVHAHFDAILASFIILIALSPAAVGYLYATEPQPEVDVVKPGPPPERVIKVIELVDADTQRQVALHEAAHAVVNAFFFGADHVSSLKLWVVTDDEELLGATFITPYDARDLPTALKCASSFLAGRAADSLLNGQPDCGSRKDLKDATALLMPLRIEYGLAGALVVKDEPSEEDYEAVEELLQKSRACAEALVVANEESIRALGELAMSKIIDGHTREIGTAELHEFFQMHPPSPPAGTKGPMVWPSGDPCAFQPMP